MRRLELWVERVGGSSSSDCKDWSTSCLHGKFLSCPCRLGRGGDTFCCLHADRGNGVCKQQQQRLPLMLAPGHSLSSACSDSTMATHTHSVVHRTAKFVLPNLHCKNTSCVNKLAEEAPSCLFSGVQLVCCGCGQAWIDPGADRTKLGSCFSVCLVMATAEYNTANLAST